MARIINRLLQNQTNKGYMITKESNMIMEMEMVLVAKTIKDLMIEMIGDLMIEDLMIEEILVRRIKKLTLESY